MTQEEIRGAVARGWCHDKNRHKEMDSDLALAISEEVENLFKHMHFEDGDVLFVDADAVDVKSLVRSFPVHKGRVSVCAIVVPQGKTLAECIEQQKMYEPAEKYDRAFD